MNIKSYFEKYPDRSIRKLLLHNCYIQNIDIETVNFTRFNNALWNSFDWYKTNESFEFWYNIYYFN